MNPASFQPAHMAHFWPPLPGTHDYRVVGTMNLLFGVDDIPDAGEMPYSIVAQLNVLLRNLENVWVDR